MTAPTPTPTGTCWCGCGNPATPGAYFLTGHDKKATGDLDAIRHSGSVAQRLVDNGYGPDGKNLHEHAIELGVRERCGIGACTVSGIPNSAGMRRHRASHQPGPATGRGAN